MGRLTFLIAFWGEDSETVVNVFKMNALSSRNGSMYYRRRAQNIGLIMLVGVDKVPPVTLSVLGLCVTLFYNFFNWRIIPSNLQRVCLQPHAIIHGREFVRLLLSAFFHADDIHLYYNMTSWLWKGMHLERRHGSLKFGVMVFVFAILTSALMTIVSYAFQNSFTEYNLMDTCAVGLSGVLFALKVLLNHNSPGHTFVYGLLVPSKYVFWLELVLISLITPNASFLGHLCGILVGLLYTRGYISPIIDGITNILRRILIPPQLPNIPENHYDYVHDNSFAADFYAAGDPYANYEDYDYNNALHLTPEELRERRLDALRRRLRLNST